MEKCNRIYLVRGDDRDNAAVMADADVVIEDGKVIKNRAGHMGDFTDLDEFFSERFKERWPSKSYKFPNPHAIRLQEEKNRLQTAFVGQRFLQSLIELRNNIGNTSSRETEEVRTLNQAIRLTIGHIQKKLGIE